MDEIAAAPPTRVARRTPFVQILRTTPSRTVCPNFYALSHANGCAFDPACDYCYLRSTLWYLDRLRIFTNVGDLLAEVRAWIARDGLESTMLNTGNLADSLGFERERPLAARIVELFRSEAERKGRPHALLLVTKRGRDAGWRVRIRIDPMIAGCSYAGLAADVGGLAPERVTLGCLRADRGLLRRGDGVFAALEPLEDPDGLARYPPADRIRMYRDAIEAMAGRAPVGQCEETADVWAAAGLDPEAKTCN